MPVTVSADAELVRILVRDEKLSIPDRCLNVKIYCHDPSRGDPTPGRPTEVVWLAFGLPGNQKVMINAKDSSRNSGYMVNGDDHGPLITGTNPLYSGKAKRFGVTWKYSVTLKDGNGRTLHTIDPDVVIDPDPS